MLESWRSQKLLAPALNAGPPGWARCAALAAIVRVITQIFTTVLAAHLSLRALRRHCCTLELRGVPQAGRLHMLLCKIHYGERQHSRRGGY